MYLMYLDYLTKKVFRRREFDRYRYYYVRATVQDFDSDIDKVVYEGCPRDCCQKKVWPTDDGFFYCPKCDACYRFFKYRYKLKVFIGDGTRTLMVTMFDDTAEPLLGVSASDISEIYDYNREEYHSFFKHTLDVTFTFKLRAALVVFRDRERLNGIVADFCDDEYF